LAVAKQVVADGFSVAEAKTEVGWEHQYTVLVGTDFGEGSMSAAGIASAMFYENRHQPRG
jgi:prolyl oligopeptidase